MTWSYDPEMGTQKDEVRFLVGDTDSADPQLQNEEITYLLAEHGSPMLAAAAACRVLASMYSRKVDKAVGDLRLSLSQRATAYRAQATELATSGSGSSVRPIVYAGGISIDDKDLIEDDTDRVIPGITIGQDDFITYGPDDTQDWGATPSP
jgi:hypothetical protein